MSEDSQSWKKTEQIIDEVLQRFYETQALPADKRPAGFSLASMMKESLTKENLDDLFSR